MRKYLKSLSPNKLLSIASDLGKNTGSFNEAIDFIIEQAKCYRWSVDDLKHRYGG